MTADTQTRDLLAQAAGAARYAPSIHNTQPWRWVVSGGRLELFAVTARQLRFQDPDRHMLLVSCGAALHHARVALDAEGWAYEVDRPAAEPLAIIRPLERGTADPAAVRRREQLSRRHTDRRTMSDEPVDVKVLDALTAAAEQAGARLDVLDRDQVIELAVLVEQAQKAETSDDLLQAETSTWVGGDRADGTGIPDASLPAEPAQTTVAGRDFGVAGTLAVGAGHDRAVTYAVLYGTGDEPADWLRAGEALNAVWLAATEHGAALTPLSGPVEVGFTRQRLGHMLGGIGTPYLVMRLGIADTAGPAAEPTPRLPVDQVVEIRD
ncbi:Acg family FMN-binding oxidoreductase [Actinoplanes flavus]|uniref:Nitroreductase n=1 Tax=Actinoplanes flavus TaxID=2820290 RepID=A0ABS3UP41_9ACTN|nr:nitroreductase family protein [Actinoplanes flavus]MBO3740231.1 nitroreductase [Actinoplanes flavus]